MTKFFLHLAQRRYEDPNAPEARSACGKMAGLVGIGCNLLLFLAKLLVGLLAGSVSITADAVNNLSDASGSIVTLVGFRLAEKPADAAHPYGHARIEYLSGLAVAALVLLIGAELVKTSIDKIFHPQAIAFSALTAAVLLGSIAVKLWMAYFYRTVGTQIQSVTVRANACDSRNDVIATAAVLLGCLVSHFFSRNIDGYIGLAVAVFILWSGVGIAKDTIAPLLGESASPELKALVAREVTAHEKVLGMHDLMVHDYGPNQKFATVHVEMDAKEDPLVCHNIIDNIERRMLARHHIHLTIHYDPVVTDDAELQEIRALLTKTLHAIDPDLSLHDLRMVRGPEHTNLVFDLVVPAALQGERAALQAKINASLPQDAGHRYYTVITYDSPDFN